MDDLQRLRQRAGIAEDFDAMGDLSSMVNSDPSMPTDQNGVVAAMRQAAQSGDRFADQMLETLKVVGNMSSREMWSRIANAYLNSGH